LEIICESFFMQAFETAIGNAVENLLPPRKASTTRPSTIEGGVLSAAGLPVSLISRGKDKVLLTLPLCRCSTCAHLEVVFYN
jgi:hypothetical protein